MYLLLFIFYFITWIHVFTVVDVRQQNPFGLQNIIFKNNNEKNIKMKLLLVCVCVWVLRVAGFNFKELEVTADSYVINTVTTYQIYFDRTTDNNFAATNYASEAITASDTITITFPNEYTLTTVTCIAQVDGGATNSQTCSIIGQTVTLTGVFSADTFVSNVTVWISNVLNPVPAVTTDSFTGTLGSDNAIVAAPPFSAFVILEPATFQSCYVTFNPTNVNSTGDMVLTITPTNQIGDTGSVVVDFTTNRWTNDLSTTNYLPISALMSCSSNSANIKSGVQCAGDNVEIAITASNMFVAATSTEFSFIIEDFLSPPTNQPHDTITITSYISGSKIDSCTTYVQDLTPNTLNSILITSSAGGSLTVNTEYTIRFDFTLVDTINQDDNFVVTFPSDTDMSFDSTTLTSNVGVNASSATFVGNVLTMYMINLGRTFNAGSSVIFTVGNFTAPPSIKPTDVFTLTILKDGYPKIEGTTTITALESTVSGSVAIQDSVVNTNTSYTITLVTIDPLTSDGKIKIFVPTEVTISISSATCANVTGTGLTSFPTCTVNATENSITLTSINSTASNIVAQTITIVLEGLINPSSTSPTSSFSATTYYESSDNTLVATGTLSGVTATIATIDPANVNVAASSYIVNESPTTYSMDVTVVNSIPAGGYFYMTIPGEIGMDVGAASSQCSININSTSYVSTPCSATDSSSFYTVNFTNPFSTDAVAGTTFIARVSAVFTNPTSTKPTSTFALYTFHSNTYSIAEITDSLTVQMNTAASFDSIAISRNNQGNYQTATYTFTLQQFSSIEAGGKLLITFPSDVVADPSCTCSMSTPVSSSLGCSLSGSVLTVTLPSSQIASSTAFDVSVTDVLNPPSFAPAGTFTLQTKTSTSLYTYSYGLSSTTLTNSVPTSFDSVTYEYTPGALDSSLTLKVTFDPSDSTITPSAVWLTLANTFTINSLGCISFVDFTGGACTFSSNTVKVSGSFTSAPMSFSVNGFTSPTAEPSDYSSLISFDSSDYKIDESTTDILFEIECTLPCKSCPSGDPTTCTSCYSNTAVTTLIYYDSTLNTCSDTCVDGKYENTITLLCTDCDDNCLTCDGSATFCLTCDSTSTFHILHISSNTTQTCVNACPSGMYPEAALDPLQCTDCVSPCVTCDDVDTCNSCVSGTFLYNNSCLNDCPDDISVENSANNQCDLCDSVCATCLGTITNCTSCAAGELIYLNQCLTDCPSPLVPQNGTCGPCDDNCQTCVNDPFTCTSCDTASAVPYLHNSLCLAVCPELYYQNISAGICSLCSDVANLHCSNCSSESTCLSCDGGYVLLNDDCLDTVPDGYVNISGVAVPCTGDCATCENTASNCTSCSTNNLLNNQCLENCPTGYIALSKQCQACVSPCKECETDVNTCTSCLTSLSPDVYLSGDKCLQVCPDGTFANDASNTCDDCQSPCQYCTSLTLCTSCLNGFFLDGSSCPTSCPTGYTGINRLCEQCQGNCATCQNQTTLCTSCAANTYLFQLNNSCVSDCGDGLFIDQLNNKCISCTDPCQTCVNSSTTCLSCFTGVLFNNACPNTCPDRYFEQTGSCTLCPDNCSDCTSLTTCTGCQSDYVLYNNFCIQNCPATHSVILGGACTECSKPSCHECTSADICTVCDTDNSLLNGACLGECPAGYQTNGTHCIDVNEEILNGSSNFPVPFSIAAAVFIIACLMSKLQFSHTYLPGAVYALLGVLEWGALVYFLYLYFLQFFTEEPLPLYIGLGALGWLYVLNIFSLIAQNVVICSDKHFKAWYSGCNCCFYIFSNFLAFITNHKFRNIVFCKLFTFSIFTACLENTNKFRIFNVFSFLSLIHSGGAIFSAATALNQVTDSNSQLYYQCIDVIIVTAINIFMAFFNTIKSSDFFYERTMDGFQLKKKIVVDDEYIQEKISPAGKEQEEEEGFYSKITHVQGQNAGLSNQPFKFNAYQIQQESDYSFGSLMDKKFQDISVQALEIIDEDKNKNQIFDISELKDHEEGEATSNFTHYFNKTDKNVQNTIEDVSEKAVQPTIHNHTELGIQNSIMAVDKSIQPSLKGFTEKSIQPSYKANQDKSIEVGANMESKQIQRDMSFEEVGIQPSFKGTQKSLQYSALEKHDQSVQRTHNVVDESVQKTEKSKQNFSIQKDFQEIQGVDRSAQRTVFYDEQSMQYASSMASKKPSVKDQSVSMGKSYRNKSIQEKPEVIDEEVDKHESVEEYSVQVEQLKTDKGNQKSISVGNYSVQMTNKTQVDQSIQKGISHKDEEVQIDHRVQYDQVNETIHPSNNEKVIFQEESNQQEERQDEKILIQEKKDDLVLPPNQIKTYQEELQERIRDKQKELNEIKKKIQKKERFNSTKQDQLQQKGNNNPRLGVGKLHNKAEKGNFKKQKGVQTKDLLLNNDDDKTNNPIQELKKQRIKGQAILHEEKPILQQVQEDGEDELEDIDFGKQQTPVFHGEPKGIIKKNEVRELKKQKQNEKKKNKKHNFSVETSDLHYKGSKSQDQYSNSKEESFKQKINLFQKEEKQEQQLQEENQNTLEQIQVVDDLGEKRKVKFEYKENSNSIEQSNPTQEQLIEMLSKKSDKFIFEDSDKNIEEGESQQPEKSSNEFKRNNPGPQYQEYQAQIISSGKGDGSTKLQTEIRRKNSNLKKYNKEENPLIDGSEYNSSSRNESNEIPEKTFNQKQKYNYRSDMSEAIEEEDNFKNRTMGSGFRTKYERAKQMVSHREKGRNQIPNEDSEKNYHRVGQIMPNRGQKKSPSHEKRSSLLIAGRSQFTEQNLARKKAVNKSPFKVAKPWDYEVSDRNIEGSGQQEIQTNRMKNRLILPTETDKSHTEFKHSGVKISQNNFQPRATHKIMPKAFDDSREDHDSSQISMPVPRVKIPVRSKIKKYEESDGHESVQPYIEDEDSDYIGDYQNNMILHQMLQRPSDDLKEYYRRQPQGRRSREKSSKKSQSHLNNETQKIYLQRLDKKWK